MLDVTIRAVPVPRDLGAGRVETSAGELAGTVCSPCVTLSLGDRDLETRAKFTIWSSTSTEKSAGTDAAKSHSQNSLQAFEPTRTAHGYPRQARPNATASVTSEGKAEALERRVRNRRYRTTATYHPNILTARHASAPMQESRCPASRRRARVLATACAVGVRGGPAPRGAMPLARPSGGRLWA